MGIHYYYKSTRGMKAMEKQAKREKKLAERKAKRAAKEGFQKKDDKIKIGQTNGMSGGLCNVVYYPEVLTKAEIDSKYGYVQLLKLNPPIY